MNDVQREIDYCGGQISYYKKRIENLRLCANKNDGYDKVEHARCVKRLQHYENIKALLQEAYPHEN